MSRYIIYTDGGARGNPGPAGAGAVICLPAEASAKAGDAGVKVVKEVHKSLGVATNNFAEYSAVILALKELKKIVPKNERPDTEIEVRADSELIVRQLSDKYEIKEPSLFPLFIAVHNLKISHFPRLKFKHIRRSENVHADRLSNLAMDESRLAG